MNKTSIEIKKSRNQEIKKSRNQETNINPFIRQI